MDSYINQVRATPSWAAFNSRPNVCDDMSAGVDECVSITDECGNTVSHPYSRASLMWFLAVEEDPQKTGYTVTALRGSYFHTGAHEYFHTYQYATLYRPWWDKGRWLLEG